MSNRLQQAVLHVDTGIGHRAMGTVDAEKEGKEPRIRGRGG